MNYAVLMLLPLAACSMGSRDDAGVAASGSGTSRTYPVADFTEVELAGSDDVDVRVGTAFSVRAEGATEDLDKLRIEREGDTLEIGRRHGWSMGRGGKVKVFVTLPRITEASLAGSGNLTVDRAEGAKFKGELAGSGNLTIRAIQVDDVSFEVAGSGDIAATGTARALEVEIAGSGDIAAAGLKASTAKVSIAGSGSVRATVVGPAKVEMMGSGDVDLGPGARCTTSKMGSGMVRCGG